MEELLTGESSSIEYKREVPSNSEKYLKTIIAFANGNGGQMVFGIEDKTCKVVGIPQDKVFMTADQCMQGSWFTGTGTERNGRKFPGQYVSTGREDHASYYPSYPSYPSVTYRTRYIFIETDSKQPINDAKANCKTIRMEC
jgi:hypothetical protein